MRWLNPAALLGLLALAVPVFVHWYGRRMAKRQRFPSLRLLQAVTPSASSRTEPSDIILLVVRCAVVLAAVLALAQPWWSSPDRVAREMLPARAIIVDTSRSMRRLTSEGASALGAARSLARAQLDSSREALVIETIDAGANIAGAASWLDTRPGLREVVVVSDFQRGAVEDGDFARVSDGIGIRPIRIGAGTADSVTADSAPGVAVSFGVPETRARWVAAATESFPVTVLSSPRDSLAVRASLLTTRHLLPHARAAHAITVVYPGHGAAAQLVRQSVGLNEVWQGDVLLALRANPVLAPQRLAPARGDCEGPYTAPVHNANGEVVASVAATDGAGLLLFSCSNPGTAAGTALLVALLSAVAIPSAWSEAEPERQPDAVLRAWARPPAAMGPGRLEETSPDGRWLWLLAVSFLLLEAWIRRRSPRRAAVEHGTGGQKRVA